MTSSAAQEYAEAYATHYERRNLLVALRSYVAVVASYPGAVEAAYSRSQIRNIVCSVVPEEELLLAQVGLALQHLQGRSKFAAMNPSSISLRDGEAADVEALEAWETDGGSRSPSPAGLKNQSGTATGTMVRLIYAGNVPDSATADELRTLFSQHGEVHTVVRPSSRKTGRLHEFAFIHMENAQVAADALDGQELDGFEIVVGTSNRRSQRSCTESVAHAPLHSVPKTVRVTV